MGREGVEGAGAGGFMGGWEVGWSDVWMGRGF
jgi:hypothetical protein